MVQSANLVLSLGVVRSSLTLPSIIMVQSVGLTLSPHMGQFHSLLLSVMSVQLAILVLSLEMIQSTALFLPIPWFNHCARYFQYLGSIDIHATFQLSGSI
jgi:hypothetical protein